MYILYGSQRAAIDKDGLFTNMGFDLVTWAGVSSFCLLFDKGINLEASAVSTYEYHAVQSSWIRMNSIFLGS